MSTTIAVGSQARTEGKSVGYWLKRISSNYLVRKIVRALFTVWFVTTLTFFLVRLMPSNPVAVYINELIVQYGLSYDEARDQATALFAFDPDQPLIQQYFDYVGQMARGNFGTSLRSPGTPVMD
ncbi:MAG: ABC transporter permease, partial [Anaerolineae bacterium]